MIVYGYFLEVAEYWSFYGLLKFMNHTVMTLVIGLIFSGMALLPYFLCSIVVKRTEFPIFMCLVCLMVLAVDISARFFGIFLSESFPILVMPFYLLIPVAVAWGVVALFSFVKRVK